MASRVAVVKGTFLRPVNSKNKRRYTTENISDAVTRMQEKIASPDGWKLSMATSHGAAYSDDALHTIGRVTKVAQNSDGSASWEADIANTTAGRDIANLAHGGYIKGVSIRGKWMSNPYSVKTDEGEMTTADKLDVFGIDFTGSPGVEGAEISDVTLMESMGDPNVFVESAEPVEISFIEEVKPTLAEQITEAARLLSEASIALNAPTPEKVAKAKETLAAEFKSALEAYASICFDNGAATINITGYTDDAGKLAAVGDRLAIAAQAALTAVDPDDDGDIDITMNGKKDSSSEAVISPDDDMADASSMCNACGASLPQSAMYCPTCGVPVNTAESESALLNKEPQVAEETTEASTETVEQESVTTATAGISEADKKDIIAGILAALKPEVTPEATPAEVTTEAAATETTVEEKTFTAAEVAEMVKTQVAASVKDITDAVRQEAQEMVRAAGADTRKGLVESETTTSVTSTAPSANTTETLRQLAQLSERNRVEADHVIGESFKADPFFGPLFDRLNANAARQYGI